MTAGGTWQRVRLATGLVSYLNTGLSPAQAAGEVSERQTSREHRFLAFARRAIFASASSPHRALLEWAGWDYDRLERAVAAEGLEATLAALRDQGVHTSLGALRRGEPVRRPGLEVVPSPDGVEEPRSRPGGVGARTSGTTSGAATRVAYDWPLFREEAALECLLFQSHGLLESPWAMWLPALPSIAGLHNLFVHLRFRHPPERWFAHAPTSRWHRSMLHYIRAVGALRGIEVPLPETVTFSEAHRVAGWLARARDRTGAAALKTFASSAVRVAEAALAQGLDLSGCIVFTGGEPLTERRSAYIASTGAQVFGRYVATESGWVAGACSRSPHPDAMHVYTSRLAVIGGGRISCQPTAPLLFTTISPGAGTILFNTDIGDAGVLSTRQCDCPLGAAGLERELSGVFGHDKLSTDGMSVSLAALEAELDGLVRAAGGTPDSYELHEEEDGTGRSRVLILLEPGLAIDEREFVRALIARLPRHGPAATIAARMWADSGAIEMRRDRLSLTAGMKLRRRL